MGEILAFGRRGRNESTRRYRKDERTLQACSFVCNSIFQPDLWTPPSSFPYKEIVVKGRRSWKVAGKAGEIFLSLSLSEASKGMVMNRRQKFAADFHV